MKALNAAGLTPVSALSDIRSEPRRVSSFPTNFPLKFSNSASLKPFPPILAEGLSRSVHGGLVLLSSVLGEQFARALTYEEALGLSGTSTSGNTSDFDVGGFFDSVVSFGIDNPAVVAGAAAILAVPLVLSKVLKSPKPWGVDSAKSAYAKLGEDADSQLLDIRAPLELRKVGTPDIGGLKKKPVSVVYKGEDKVGFLNKLALKFKEPEKTTLFILDKYDGNSELVAELVTANGFKAAFAIKDGADGQRGWVNSGLPWKLPKKTLSLDIGFLSDAISNTFGDASDALPVTVGIAAAAGFGLLAFTEVETILQLLGSAALIQFVSKKLLYAEDRKVTLKQLDEFVNTKIAPKELVGEIQQIGRALLPSSVNGKALPAPTETSSKPVDPVSNIQKAEAVVEQNDGAASTLVPVINSNPKEVVNAESLGGIPRALSPYPHYPDFKPPTSPAPSQP